MLQGAATILIRPVTKPPAGRAAKLGGAPSPDLLINLGPIDAFSPVCWRVAGSRLTLGRIASNDHFGEPRRRRRRCRVVVIGHFFECLVAAEQLKSQYFSLVARKRRAARELECHITLEYRYYDDRSGECRDKGASMPLSKTAVSAPPPIERPTCPKCSSLMWLARIMPDEPGCDQRTFECAECGHEIVRIFRWRPLVEPSGF